MSEHPESTDSPAESAAADGSTNAPENSVDQAILAGQVGTKSNQEVLDAIWNAQLISVGRMVDENDPSTFQALSLKVPDSEEKIVVTFSDPKHIPDQLRKVAPFAIRNSGQVTLRSVQPGYGMAINPGISPGIELRAEAIAQIQAAFDAQSAARGAGLAGTAGESPASESTAGGQEKTPGEGASAEPRPTDGETSTTEAD